MMGLRGYSYTWGIFTHKPRVVKMGLRSFQDIIPREALDGVLQGEAKDFPHLSLDTGGNRHDENPRR
jgi:hypothetical protein